MEWRICTWSCAYLSIYDMFCRQSDMFILYLRQYPDIHITFACSRKHQWPLFCVSFFFTLRHFLLILRFLPPQKWRHFEDQFIDPCEIRVHSPETIGGSLKMLSVQDESNPSNHHQTFQVAKMEVLTYKPLSCMDTSYVKENPSPKWPKNFRFRKPSILGTWNSWWNDVP